MKTVNENVIPEGYMKRPDGSLQLISKIKEQDLLRDQLVNDLFKQAKTINKTMVDFKKVALKDVEDLVAIAGERYDVWMGGNKGNVSLVSYDGRLKVTRTYREVIAFTEELESAKKIIDSCLRRWGESANPNIIAVISQAFRTNTKQEIKTGKVLELMRLNINDEEWLQGMEALKDALQVLGTCVYLRFYERVGEADEWQAVSLDLAAV